MMEREFEIGASGSSSSISFSSDCSTSSGAPASSAYHHHYQHPSKTSPGNNINYFFETDHSGAGTFKKPPHHFHNQFHSSSKYDQAVYNQQHSLSQQRFEKTRYHKVQFQHQPQASYQASHYGTHNYQYSMIQANASRFDQRSTIPVHYSQCQPIVQAPQFQPYDSLARNVFCSPNVQMYPNQLQHQHFDKNNQQLLHHLHLQKTPQAQDHQMYKPHTGYVAPHPQYSQYQNKYNMRHSYLQQYDQQNLNQHCTKVTNQFSGKSSNHQNQREIIQQYLNAGNHPKPPQHYETIENQQRQTMESMQHYSDAQTTESMKTSQEEHCTNSLTSTKSHLTKETSYSNCISTKEGFDFWMGYMGTEHNDLSNYTNHSGKDTPSCTNHIGKAKKEDHNCEEHTKPVKRPFENSKDDLNKNAKRFKDEQLEVEQTEGDGGYYTEPDSDINNTIDRENDDLNRSFDRDTDVKLFNCSYCKKKNIVYHCSCREKVYCGQLCQEADWEEGGHQLHPDHN